MRTLLIAAALAMTTVLVQADVYRVSVTWKDTDLYTTSDGVVIKTRYCLELALLDSAVLNWEGPYGRNWIVFKNGKKCDVVGVY